MSKKALIVGHTGQDGYYLIQILENEGFKVYGVSSSSTYSNDNYIVPEGSINDSKYCDILIQEIQPDHLYFLAALHQSSIESNVDDLLFYKQTINTNSIAYLNFLHSINIYRKNCNVFYASSSHIFGGTTFSEQNELTPLCPISIYGVSKVLGMNFSDLYRTKGINCSVGILYNHESPRRASKFVSKKIVETAVKIKFGQADNLVLGDLGATIDWGYAPDYMKAAFLLLESNKSGNYIVSSGCLHTVKDFVSLVFSYLNLDYLEYVSVDKNIIQKKNTTVLKGDNTKLKQETNWSNSVTFEEMIRVLVDSELSNFK